MIIVDVEASGVDPNKNSLLSIGALDFDDPENQFYEECRIWDGAHVEKEALEVNGFTKEQIVDPNKKSDRELVEDFLVWAESCKERTFAGQNPSFDRDFIQQTAYRYHLNWSWALAHRTIDLHSVAYFKMLKDGKTPPSKNSHSALGLEEIIKMLGINLKRGKHNALEDAKVEAECLHRLIYNKSLFKEFS